MNAKLIEAAYPLSPMQQGMLFHTLHAPQVGVYFGQMTCTLSGALNLPLFQAAWQRVVDRHPILRTAFAWENLEQPIQVVGRNAKLPWTELDWQALSPLEQQQQLSEFLNCDRQRGFTLSKAPLMRLTLIGLAPTTYYLIWSYHHLLLDGWSSPVLIQEVMVFYQAFCQGQDCDLPQPRPYQDYLTWLQQQDLSQAERFWRNYLCGFTTPTALNIEPPIRQPCPSPPGYGEHSLPLSQTTTAALQAFARQHRFTLSTVIQGGWAVLLSRYSGESEVVFGVTVSGRPPSLAGVESMVGVFINTLPMRVKTASALPCVTWLKQFQAQQVNLLQYDYTPLVQIQRWSDIPRGTSLFETIVVFENYPAPAALSQPLPGLIIENVQVFEQNNYPLTLKVVPGSKLKLAIVYERQRFTPDTITRMLHHLRQVLEGIIAHPSQSPGEWSLLTPTERNQVLIWNKTQTDYDQLQCIHQPFERQVEKTPDAIAITSPDQQITYKTLNDHANQLAHHLKTLGVTPGTSIGICLDRSSWMLVGLLGILKAGGTYVPFDPEHPPERLRQMLSALNIPVMVTDYAQLSLIYSLQSQLPSLSDVICLDVETPKPPPESLNTQQVKALWDQIAHQAIDEITAGGFISSYTGQPFSLAEVEEYRDHVVEQVKPYLKPNQRVLEVGCGSGLIMFTIALHVAEYVGLDPSEVTQQSNQKKIDERGDTNIQLLTGFAHEIENLQSTSPTSFDIILFASTIQFFPGLLYLTQSLEKALDLLAPGGILLIADVLDSRRKDEFRQSLEAFQNQHRNDSTIKTKTRLDSELYVDEDIFYTLKDTHNSIADVQILRRDRSFNNELRYRYDVILVKADPNQLATDISKRTKRTKTLWTGWHLNQQPQHNRSTSVTADHLAYIIHTSGSTGVPKGVAVCHRSVMNLIEWVNSTYHVGATDQLLFVTSLCFDLSVYDIFGPLAVGGSIRIASKAELHDPQRLLHILCHEPITFWDSAPAVLQQLAPWFTLVHSSPSHARLRLVFLSGDWIPVTLPDQLKAKFPGVQIIGLGGATEATIWSNFYPIETVDPNWVSIPYGKPIQNAQYYVLDPHLHPCPVGVSGDLYIAGDCLAYGYLNDPVKTAEKFIPNPYGNSDRLYHTGDLARWLPDGNIEFLGRRDHQVKIRGFRIELGDIQAHLSRHPGIQDAIVLAREDEPGDKRLVAYLVTRSGWTLTTADIRRFLSEILPEYMCPAAFVFLPTMPLTANGKVDRVSVAEQYRVSVAEQYRQALPAPGLARTELTDNWVAPRTPAEAQLATLWQQLLKVEPIGIHDDFFELGGHSLLLTQLLTQVRQKFDVELSLPAVMNAPTIATLAQYLERQIEGNHPEANCYFQTSTVMGKPVLNLEAEAVLDPVIQPQSPWTYPTVPQRIFLTGATGFLGAFLLAELLRQTTADIYCLVRSPNSVSDQQRIQACLQSYLLWDDSWSQRIIPVFGDLAQPRLGLSESQFQYLADCIDVIYHNGAWVHHVLPYSILKSANVLSTQEILRLAAQSYTKPVHFISTTSVFSGSDSRSFPPITEQDIPNLAPLSANGYTQSKWVAERLITLAGDRALPVCIYRPGRISGHSQTGVFNPNDFLYKLMMGCIQLGKAPDIDMLLDMVPVDYASQAIVHLSRQSSALGKTFHIVNSASLTATQLIHWLQSRGYSIQPIPYKQWQTHLFDTAGSPDHPLHSLIPFFADNFADKQLLSDRDIPLSEAHSQSVQQFDDQNTRAGLAETSITCPPLDDRLLNVYFSYLDRNGYLTPVHKPIL